MHDLHPSGSPTDDDAELVEAARAGVRSALEQLIRRYNQQLYRIARAHLGSDDEAEDLTQQAWLSIVSNLNQWSGRGTFTAWAATIVVNACRARHRGVRAQDPHDDEVDPRPPPPTPDEEGHRHEVRAVLEHTIDQLSPALRVVFVMRDVEGLSGVEIAQLLGLTEEAVRARLHRARQTLQRSLDLQFQGEARALYPFLGARCHRLTIAVLNAVRAADT